MDAISVDASTCIPRSISRLHCAGKVLIAVVVLLEHVRGRLDLDAPVSTLGVPVRDGYSVRQLLTHTAGLGAYAGPELRRNNEQAVLDAICEQLPPPGYMPGRQVHYNAFSSWQLLAATLRAIGIEPRPAVSGLLRDLAVAEVLPPGMNEQTFVAVEDRLASLFTPECYAPSREAACTPYYGEGAYASAFGLASLYARLLHEPGEIAAVTELMRRAGAKQVDNSTGAQVRYGLGAVVDVGMVLMGRCFSSESFGLSGLYGTVTGVADPVTGVSASLIFADHIEGIAAPLRRAEILEALLEDLGVWRPRRPRTLVFTAGRPNTAAVTDDDPTGVA
jgi:CubicO group peptidase (beta-lactamase class C family)